MTSTLALCSLTASGPFHISSPREYLPDQDSGRNDAAAFLATIAHFITSGAVVRGNVLVFDNARIHFAYAIREPLEAILRAAGVRLIFLPKYSPELNPCELIFADAKGDLRNYRGNLPFWNEVLLALARVSHKNVWGYYRKSLLHPLMG